MGASTDMGVSGIMGVSGGMGGSSSLEGSADIGGSEELWEQVAGIMGASGQRRSVRTRRDGGTGRMRSADGVMRRGGRGRGQEDNQGPDIHPSGLGQMTNPGNSCFAGSQLLCLTEIELDQHLSLTNRNTAEQNLDQQIGMVQCAQQ